MRITSEYTRAEGSWIGLRYVIEGFCHSLAFCEAQESGYIPLDEPYDFGNVIATDEHGRLLFNTLDAPARPRLLELHQANLLPVFAPDLYLTTNADEGAVEPHAFMAVAVDRYLLGRVRLRDCGFTGVGPCEIAEQLAVAEVATLAERWIAGDAVACNGVTLAQASPDLLRQMLVQELGRVDTGRSGHRDGPLRECCGRFTRRITR